MSFQRAGAAEVLRAAQKDETFLSRMKSYCSEIIQRTLGTRVWLDIHKYVEIFIDLIYYGLTTLSLNQTLGEEYTGILQVDSSRRNLPSFTQRTLLTLVKCFGPFILKRILTKIEQSARSGKLSLYLRPELKNVILQYIPTLRYILTLLQRLHLSIFYFNGLFYHIANRVSGVNFVLVREWLGDNTARKSFQQLSVVLFTHIVLTVLHSLYNAKFSKKYQEDLQSSPNCYLENKDQCPLCLDKRKFSSVTPCGHLYCWQCIHECLQTSQQCPLCRHPATPANIVPLLNYD
ncbi:unnamed protein product [Meganyctiphanes norvegica]|uniref:RING-type E3 ubiquitin transferase n=2 Tax=Meganyctiphanes norvegica TaxID=48144 RepID=A0AAV2PNP9_MEGNR